jgi:hypothetical protein
MLVWDVGSARISSDRMQLRIIGIIMRMIEASFHIQKIKNTCFGICPSIKIMA